MNRYQIESARERINGYYIPRLNEQRLDAFERAKAETLKHMRDQIERIEALTPDQFFERSNAQGEV